MHCFIRTALSFPTKFLKYFYVFLEGHNLERSRDTKSYLFCDMVPPTRISNTIVLKISKIITDSIAVQHSSPCSSLLLMKIRNCNYSGHKCCILQDARLNFARLFSQDFSCKTCKTKIH